MASPEGYSQQDLERMFASFPNTGTVQDLCEVIARNSRDAIPIHEGALRPLDVWDVGFERPEGLTIGIVSGFHPTEKYILVRPVHNTPEYAPGEQREPLRVEGQQPARWTDIVRL